MNASIVERALPTLQIGDFLIQAISDGHLTASLDLLSHIDPAEAAQLQLKAGVSAPSSIHINTYLVRGRAARSSSTPVPGGSRAGRGVEGQSIASRCAAHGCGYDLAHACAS